MRLRQLVLIVTSAVALAGSSAARPVSVPPSRTDALVGGRVVLAPGRVLERATVLVRDGVILDVGPDVAVPQGALTWDVSGLTIHAGFIDAHLALSRINGVPLPPEPGTPGAGPDAAPPAPARGPLPSKSGSGHPRVHPEVRVLDWLAPDEKALEALRGQGFTAACVVPDHGILRGRDAVVALGGEAAGRSVIRDLGDIHGAFESSGWGSDEYPGSVMGATAVLRQTLSDADWYRRARQATLSGPDRVDTDASLQAAGDLVPVRSGVPPLQRLVMDCRDVLDVLRAGQLAAEFGARLRLRAAGDEYRRLDDVVALRVPLVVPVAFPATPKVADEQEWVDVDTAVLRHWRLAPDNARWLHEAGADVSLTTDGLKDVSDFGKRLQRAIRRGLRPQDALAMLTTHPASMLGVSDRLGTVEPGKLAHLVVATGMPFEPGTEIREAWVDGLRRVVARAPKGPLGTWSVEVTAPAPDGGEPSRFRARLLLASADGALSWEKGAGGPGDDGDDSARKAVVSNVRVDGDLARFSLGGAPWGASEPLTAEIRVDGERLEGMAGALSLAGGRVRPEPSAPVEPPPSPLPVPRRDGGPLTGGDDVLLRNVTAWTCGQQGILPGVDLLVRDGVIRELGPGLSAPQGVPVLDLAGKHVTPGLIDAHSHAAIVGGVNEGTNSCTAEVRIGDVVNSETIDIYRLLAGGLTTANLLHGSANCMGGQSQVIRLKWGEGPEGLKFRQAWPMIKFALGENVKQSNWGEKFVTRYPQTRMGVEQFMREKFQEARDWDERWRARTRRGEAPPRRDLQLECLAEILRGERKIHCHSYRQDEILGLMRVAEEFGFRVGTFQHILEGYKVADEMAAHGAAGSSFTDWWAYKFEVYDAIPYNPALMWQRGVLVSVNSDSTELARRMQLEAAKVVKWGGVPEAEALKFVTLNSARQLGIDAVVGSLEVGKQADLAVWSGSPLSTGSLCESTWIEGVKYFDRSLDLAGRAARDAERADLIDLARKAQDGDDAAGERWSASYLVQNLGCREVGGVHAHGESQP